MIVVADTGPIISLAVINKLDLLETLYGEVYIGETIWQEISRYIEPFKLYQAAPFGAKVKKLFGHNLFLDLMDPGEAEAVALYQELHADYLIIDDRAARRIAETQGVQCVGALAVLAKAKELCLVSALRPLFSSLLSSHRYYKKQLLNMLLKDYNEPPLD